MRGATSRSSPIFPGDDDGARLSRLVKKIVFVCWTAPPRFVALIALVHTGSLVRACWGLMPMPVAAAVWALLRRGRTRAAAALVVFEFWGHIFTGSFIGTGLSGPSFGGFMLVIPMAGLLLGIRASLLTTGLSMLGGLVLLVLEDRGLLPPAPPAPGPVFLLVSCLYFIVSAAVVTWALGSGTPPRTPSALRVAIPLWGLRTPMRAPRTLGASVRSGSISRSWRRRQSRQ